MFRFTLDPRRIVEVSVALAFAFTGSAVVVDAIDMNHPGSVTESGITGEMWAHIDAGSLTTMHRSVPVAPVNEALALPVTGNPG